MAPSRKLVTLFSAIVGASGFLCILLFVLADLTRNRDIYAEDGSFRGAIRSATANRDGRLEAVAHRTRQKILMASNIRVSLSTHNTGLSTLTGSADISAKLTDTQRLMHQPRNESSPTRAVQISASSNESTSLYSSMNAIDTSLYPSKALESLTTPDPAKLLICHYFSVGRFGNHLFEYASILGIARTTNRSAFFPNNGQLLGYLKYPPEPSKASTQLKTRCRSAVTKYERYTHICRYDQQLFNLDGRRDYTLCSYFQSWMYFDGIQDEIRQAVTFSDEIVRQATVVISRLKTAHPNTTLVGIHNRRGDLATEALRKHGYLTAPPEFFNKSMTYFRDRFSRVLFVVLGEDSLWSAENIHPVNDDVIFLQPNSSPRVDMQILSMTDHMIRTVGTFGWWAAFKIPGKPTIVYLKDFVTKGSPLSELYSENAEDYVLPHWIGM